MKKRKILSFILAFSLVLLLFSWQIPFVFAEDHINGSITIDTNAKLKALSGNIVDGPLTLNFGGTVLDGGYSYFKTISNPNGYTITVNGNNTLIKNLFTTNGFIDKAGDNSSFSGFGIYNCSVSSSGYSGDNGVGLLCGSIGAGSTVSNCFTAGSIYIMDSDSDTETSNIGGMFGKSAGNITNSFSMCDIYTDIANVGGLVGYCTEDASMSAVYSTGNIINQSADGTENYKYVGGLVGKSDSNDITNSYTSTFIHNAYSETVNAIGAIEDVSDTVCYDLSVSLQRQGPNDLNGLFPDEFPGKFNNTSWSNPSSDFTTRLYPELSVFVNHTNTAFKSISKISVAHVDIAIHIEGNDASGNSTGREYTQLSTQNRYSKAYLTIGGGFNWHISGGVDEYFFDPSEYYSSQKGGRTNGLSGNTYDSDDGCYLFVNEGDVNFTAELNGYERTISVHVTNDNPYFSQEENGVYNQKDLDGVRVYCNAYPGRTYTVKKDIELSGFAPIYGFQGTFIGAKTESGGANDTIRTISGLNLIADFSRPFVNAGLFSDIAGPASVEGIHISGAVIAPYTYTDENEEEITNAYANAGLLVGKIDTSSYVLKNPGSVPEINISKVFATGSISGTDNAGMIIGLINPGCDVTLDRCASSGIVQKSDGMSSETKNAGGILANGKATITDCYSSAVLLAENNVGGIVGNSLTGTVVNSSIFTGMLDCSGNTKSPIANTATVTGCYFDKQASAVSLGDNAKTTAQLISSDFTMNENWHISSGIYPQLLCFAGASDKIQHASVMINIPVIYKFNDTDDADSTYFTTATVDYSNTAYSSYNISYDDTQVNGKYTPSSSVKPHSYTLNEGGKGFVKVSANGYTDFRYLYFNVKSATIYYKFTGSGYNNYCTNCASGMMKFNVAVPNGSLPYSCALDTSVTAFSEPYKVVIPLARDSMTFDFTVPFNGIYSLGEWKAYDSDDRELSINRNTNFVPIPSDGIVKIELPVNIIDSTDIPWGNYSFKSN